MRKSVNLLYALALTLSLSCSGNGDDDGPTAPPSNPRQVAVTFVLENAGNSSTLQEVRLSLDNQVIDTRQGAAINALALQGVVNGVSRGSHTVSVTIVRQTRSPTQYRMGSSLSIVPNTIVINGDGRTLDIVHLPVEVVSLRTGDSKQYQFTVP